MQLTLASLRNLAGRDFSRMLGGSGFIFGCRLTGAALTFVTQMLLSRWMGATELGYYLLAFSWCILLARLAGMGYSNAAVRFIGHGLASGDNGLIRGFAQFTGRIVSYVSLALAVAGIVVILIAGQHSGDVSWPMLLAFVCIPVFARIHLQKGIAVAFSWFRLAFIPGEVLRPLLVLALIVAAWFAGVRLTATLAMLLQTGALLIVAVGLYVAFNRRLAPVVRHARPSYESSLWTQTSLPLLIIALFTTYFPELTVILVGVFLPPDEVAVYTIAYRTALLIAFGITAVDAFMIPRGSRLYAAGNTVELQRLVARATQLRFWAAVLALAGFVWLGKPFLRLFGEEFVSGYPALIILSLAQVLRAAVGPVTQLLSVSGHQNECLYVFAWAILMGAALLILITPIYGINGAAAVATLVIVLWAIWLHKLVVRNLGIRPSVLAFGSAFR